MIDVEGETVLSDGRTVAKCETDKSGFRQKRFAGFYNPQKMIA
jgi:hypothetical protein